MHTAPLFYTVENKQVGSHGHGWWGGWSEEDATLGVIIISTQGVRRVYTSLPRSRRPSFMLRSIRNATAA
jgi:hypothetical protein